MAGPSAAELGLLWTGDGSLRREILPEVGTKAERRAARERVAAYHEVELAALVGHVVGARDRYRAGEIDVFAVDETIHQYPRVAQELGKFCWSGGVGAHIEMIAGILDRQSIDGDTVDWWQRGRPRRPASWTWPMYRVLGGWKVGGVVGPG